jgi:hypothetical protein
MHPVDRWLPGRSSMGSALGFSRSWLPAWMP